MSLSSLPLRDLQYDGHARLVLADARAAFAQPAAPSSSRTVKAGHPTPSECSKTRTSASGDSPLLSSAAGDGLEAAPSSRVSVCSSLAAGSAGPPSARISFPSGGTDFRFAAATSGDAPVCLMSTLDGLVPSSPSAGDSCAFYVFGDDSPLLCPFALPARGSSSSSERAAAVVLCQAALLAYDDLLSFTLAYGAGGMLCPPCLSAQRGRAAAV